MMNLRLDLESRSEPNEKLIILFDGYHRTVTTVENTDSRNSCEHQLVDPPSPDNVKSSSLCLAVDSKRDPSFLFLESYLFLPGLRQLCGSREGGHQKRNGDADCLGNAFSADHNASSLVARRKKFDGPNSKCKFHPQNAEPLQNTASLKHYSNVVMQSSMFNDRRCKQANGKSLCSVARTNHGCSDARLTGKLDAEPTCGCLGCHKCNGDLIDNGLTADASSYEPASAERPSCKFLWENTENALGAVSSKHDSEGASELDSDMSVCSDDRSNNDFSDARFKCSSSANSLQPKAAIFPSVGSLPQQNSSYVLNDDMVESNDDCLDSRFKASASTSLLESFDLAESRLKPQEDAPSSMLARSQHGTSSPQIKGSFSVASREVSATDENISDFAGGWSQQTTSVSRPSLLDSQFKASCSLAPFNSKRPSDLPGSSLRHTYDLSNKHSKLQGHSGCITRAGSVPEGTSASQHKVSSFVGSLRNSSNEVGIAGGCSMVGQDSSGDDRTKELDFNVDACSQYDSVDLVEGASPRSNLSGTEQLVPDISESPGRSSPILLETSTSYRKRKSQLNAQADIFEPSLIEKTSTTALHNRNHDGSFYLAEETVTHRVGRTDETPDSEETVPEDASCRIPFNGHREDIHHFRLCDVVFAGQCLRGEHSCWLEDIPSDSDTTQVVHSIIGQSCKRILLNGKCPEVSCPLKHTVNLDFDMQLIQHQANFNIFTKWFLDNAPSPDFRGIWLMISRLPKDDVLMIVFSYAKMIRRLTNKIYRQALGMKLLEILVNVMGLKPWEAVRALLVFSVTQATTLPEIEDLLNSLEVWEKSRSELFKNRLFQSMSCLWHLSEAFVCPADLLFKLVSECLAQMPTDLKFVKDKMVADLMSLPRRVILKDFVLIDKFLSKFYPQNSEIAHVVRSRVLYGADPTWIARNVAYDTSRVKRTGPVNPEWTYWDIGEARTKSFEEVLRGTRRNKSPSKVSPAPNPTCDLVFENLEDDASCDDLFRILSKRNILWYKPAPVKIDSIVESLHCGRYSDVVAIISSCNSEQVGACFGALRRELEMCDKSHLPAVAFEVLRLLGGPSPEIKSARSDFVHMLNSLVIQFYREADFRSALKLIKTMRVSNVNHVEHVEDIDPETYAVICSEVHLECRLYAEAIRCLLYKDCLNFAKYNTGSLHFHLLERVVTKMFKTFLKHRLSSHAVDIFRVVLTAQEDLRFPLDIGRFYEGVLFLSFVRDLKKNASAPSEGANLYVTVDRLCGNDEPFHSITYRSLLVELHLADSPEDVLRRTLLICLRAGVYPDVSLGPFHPLVFNSRLTTEEMTVYLRHYFAYFVARDDLRRLEGRPLVVRFFESLPLAKMPFPVANDVMKTPGSVLKAVERLKSALQQVAGPIYEALGAEFSPVGATIPKYGVGALLDELKRQ